MARKLHITLLVDEAEVPEEDPQFKDAHGKNNTEYHVAEGLRLLGHEVCALPAYEDVAQLATALMEIETDLVFNLTEHIGGNRLHDKTIAGLIDLAEIPFTGAGPTGLLLCRDKRLCKELLSLHRVRVPKFYSFPTNHKVRLPKNIDFPLVVKPAFEDGSEGISNASIVSNHQALEERIHHVHQRWNQPVIAEQYIEGREFYVTLLGNKRLTVLPFRECAFNYEGADGPRLATFSVKYNDEYRKKWNVEFGFADLDSETTKKIERVCKRSFRALHMRDYARLDLRLTPEGNVYVLEVNPNPDLAFGEEVAESAEKAGITYEKLLNRIIKSALSRYK